MAKETILTTYVHPKGYCPVRGACTVSTPGEEGSTTTENNISRRFALRGYINNIYSHVIRINNWAKSVFHTADNLENKLLGLTYKWLSEYYFWMQGTKYFIDDNLRYKIWKETAELISNLREEYNKLSSSSESMYRNNFDYEIQQLEELHKKAKKEALQVQLVAYITDPEHDVIEDDEYENITGNILHALPRLGVDVFKIGFFPKAETSENERNVTAFVTSRTYFNDLGCTIYMKYTTETTEIYDKVPSLHVKATFPPEEEKCGDMYQYWFLVGPQPFYKLHFQVIGGSVTAHKILILGGRKLQYVWSRMYSAAPIPGVTTSSLIIEDYFKNVLYYIVDTVEKDNG